MSESERRRKYHYNRVLIETERILTPEFSDAVVFLSGAQVEMLRNVTQYLARLDTYVTEYNPGYYLTPTVADYDDILEIVADLEETLMGNPNTLWGYKDTIAIHEYSLSPAGPNLYLTAVTVPAGSVYVMHELSMYNVDGTTARQLIQTNHGGPNITMQVALAVPAGIYTTWKGTLPLKEGDLMLVKFETFTALDDLHVVAWGYEMEV